LLVEAADTGDEDEEAGCSSDDDWLPERMPPAAGSQQVVKVVYKVWDFKGVL
jgi:hypothetical protein